MVHIVVRDYRQDDWPAVCRIHDAARRIEVRGFMPPDIVLPMDQTAGPEGFFESQTWVACVEPGEQTIAGFIAIKGAEITWCYVDPSWHRQGIGRKLVEHVKPILGEHGFVLTVAENPAGVAFYQSLGFVVCARFPGEAQGYPCECVRLALPTSRHRQRPPTPTALALRLAGFTQELPGRAFLGEDGIYDWA
ncbi:MAG: GNAT family N-acetyltransferase [Tepidisphaeraceae bacterium]